MKKLNKKGFTIVELVIVIAVIAILAAVMIPTFSGMVTKANESAALQDAEATFKNDLILLDGQAFNFGKDAYKKDVYTLTKDNAIDNSKSYYIVNNDTYTKVDSPNVAAIATYYEKSVVDITVGTFTFDPANQNAYTYTVETDEYKAVFENGSWKVTLK